MFQITIDLKKTTLAFALSEQWVSALFGQGVALFFNFFLEKKFVLYFCQGYVMLCLVVGLIMQHQQF